MRLFDLFRKDRQNVDWDAIKQSEKVYPKNSISLITTKMEDGTLTTGWVDLAYMEYEFKRSCPYNLQFSIEINEHSLEHSDVGTIEDYFIDELKKGCIVHPVSRVTTDFGFIMDVYIDNPDFASKALTELNENAGKLVEFGCGFNHDPKWKEYSRIVSLVNGK